MVRTSALDAPPLSIALRRIAVMKGCPCESDRSTQKTNRPGDLPVAGAFFRQETHPMPSIRHTLTTDDGEFLVYTETPAGDVNNMELLDD